MTVNAVSNNYVVYDSNGKSKTVNKNDEELVFSAGKNSTNTIDADYACTDGQDDGKISFGEGVKSFIKGIGKTAVNMVVGPIKELANGNPVPALLAGVGIAATAIIGAPAVVALGAVGVVTGGVQAVSGISKALNAQTDGEAKAALEQTGGGVFTAGVSALAVKGGLKSMETSVTKMGKTSELAKVNEQIKAGEIKGFGKLTSKVKAYGADSKTIINNKFNGVLTKAEGKIADSKERIADSKAHKEYIKEHGLQDEKILSQDEIDALIQEQQKPVTTKPQGTEAGGTGTGTGTGSGTQTVAADKAALQTELAQKQAELADVYNECLRYDGEGAPESLTQRYDALSKDINALKQQIGQADTAAAKPLQAGGSQAPAVDKAALQTELTQKQAELADVYNECLRYDGEGAPESLTQKYDTLSKDISNLKQQLGQVDKPAAQAPVVDKAALQVELTQKQAELAEIYNECLGYDTEGAPADLVQRYQTLSQDISALKQKIAA